MKELQHLVGQWITEASHPALPGVDVHGSADIEWLEGEQFLIHRSKMDHPDFPDGISIIGHTERDRVDDEPAAGGDKPLTMHYFDSRGVFRVYEVSIDESAWKIWRNAPGFSQRFTGAVTDGGKIIAGLWQISKDDKTWDDDLRITYRRR
jgi:hypothetical protein